MYRVRHWDTFDNVTAVRATVQTLEEARDFVAQKYGKQLSSSGADWVEIVDERNIVVQKFQIC